MLKIKCVNKDVVTWVCYEEKEREKKKWLKPVKGTCLSEVGFGSQEGWAEACCFCC